MVYGRVSVFAPALTHTHTRIGSMERRRAMWMEEKSGNRLVKCSMKICVCCWKGAGVVSGVSEVRQENLERRSLAPAVMQSQHFLRNAQWSVNWNISHISTKAIQPPHSPPSRLLPSFVLLKWWLIFHFHVQNLSHEKSSGKKIQGYVLPPLHCYPASSVPVHNIFSWLLLKGSKDVKANAIFNRVPNWTVSNFPAHFHPATACKQQ